MVRFDSLWLWDCERDRCNINRQAAFILIGPLRLLTPIIIVVHDIKRGEGGYRCRYGNHVPLPNGRASAWGQLEWGASSGSPRDTTREADYGA